MIYILVGHGSGAGATVAVRREGDEVRVSVALGPDSSPTAETERAWLSRIALRHGGRHELEGGQEALIFPADGASDRNESAALRKELDEARKQGEVYARELAAVFDRGEEVTALSTVPPGPGVPSEPRLGQLTKLCAGIASEITSALGGAAKDLAPARREGGDDVVERVRRRVGNTMEIVAELASIGELRVGELDTEIDLDELVRQGTRAVSATAEREGVRVLAHTAAAGEPARRYVRRGAKVVQELVRVLLTHAIEASPRDGTVEISVHPADLGAGPRIIVDDAGSPLPASGRRSFLSLETHAGAYGRPSGLPIFLAAELAACQGAVLELSDAPVTGGLRVAVTFAKT